MVDKKPKKSEHKFENEIRTIIDRISLGSLVTTWPTGLDQMGISALFQPEWHGVEGNKANPNKVYRLNGRRTKSNVLQDQQLRDNFEYHAGLLGLSFDQLMSRQYDLFVETALNLHPNAMERFNHFKEEKIWKTAHVYQHLTAEWIPFFRIYRISDSWKQKKIQDKNKSFFRFAANKLEIHLRLPKSIHQELFGPAGNAIFKATSRPKFLKYLFDSFLSDNNVKIPSASYMSEEYLTQLESTIDAFAEREFCAPHGWLCPPIKHSIQDLENKFITFSYLRKQDHLHLSAHFQNVKFLKGIVVIPFHDVHSNKDKALNFNSVRDLLPYVQERLWRDPSSFFTLLLLQFLREHDLFETANSTTPKDFAPKLAELIKNIPSR